MVWVLGGGAWLENGNGIHRLYPHGKVECRLSQSGSQPPGGKHQTLVRESKIKSQSTASGLGSHLAWRSVLSGCARLHVSGAFLVCLYKVFTQVTQ